MTDTKRTPVQGRLRKANETMVAMLGGDEKTGVMLEAADTIDELVEALKAARREICYMIEIEGYGRGTLAQIDRALAKAGESQ